MLCWSEQVLFFSRGRHCRSTVDADACKTFCSQPPPYGLVWRETDRRPYILVNVHDPANTIVKNLLQNLICSVDPCKSYSQWGARTKMFVWFVAENSRNCVLCAVTSKRDIHDIRISQEICPQNMVLLNAHLIT